MKIRHAEYAGTVAQPDGPRPEGDLPQIAFSGRSNVGKSSLINVILNRTRHKIAKVSGKPGKTQAINFYRVNTDEFFLVDLPGFGYAEVPKAMRDQWKGLIEGYLASPNGPVGVVHLVDCRRPPTQLDLEMLDYLASIKLPVLIVLTKMDKLKASARRKSIEKAVADLGITEDQLVPFSSLNGEGREPLLEALGSLIESAAR